MSAVYSNVSGQSALSLGRDVIHMEAQAVSAMAHRLGAPFELAVDMILSTAGRLVVVGMGKSGIIGRKIVATMASTGTPALFVHPGEAFHGDLGMIKPTDTVLMISNSGETEELLKLLPFFQHQGNRLIAMTGRLDSTLAVHAHVTLDVSVPREACSNNLAPTASTTATLVMGDALAVALSTLRGFAPEDFARFHPGGNLGRRLLTRVRDVMQRFNLPVCAPDADFKKVVHTITRGRLGLALVMDGKTLHGIITDGDLRRALERTDEPFALRAEQMMTRDPMCIDPDEMFAAAEDRMRETKVSALVVKSHDDTVLGVLRLVDEV